MGFSSYRDYVLLKLHFNEPKFNWNRHFNYQRITPAIFSKRRDRVFFQGFEECNPERDQRIELFISAFLQGNKAWIGDVKDDKYHMDRMARVSHLESLFKQDCQKLEFWLLDHNVKLCNILLTTGLEPCIMIDNADAIGISLETIALIHVFDGFLDDFFPIHPLWKEKKSKYVKYGKLLMQLNKNFDMMRNLYETLQANFSDDDVDRIVSSSIGG